MENASKALIMAGGILISILIIGVVVYMFSTSSGLFTNKQTEEEIRQLKEFNDQYESYNRKLLRGTDVISVMNRVMDNNTKYGVKGYNEPNYLMQVEFEMKEAIVYTKAGTSEARFNVGERYNISSFSNIKNSQDAFTDFKRRIFDCTEVKHHATTGRVNYMLFVERKMSNSEYEGGVSY